MNTIAISNVAIRQTENNLYNLNDLHKASGGEKRHELTNWLKLQQTTELIDELSKPEISGLEENQQVIKVVRGGNKRGTYACKELVYAYATWISAKFFLLVIRTFDAVVTGRLKTPESKTTVDERTPLRQAVSALVGLRRVDYSTAYNMVHQRFGVERIEDLPREQLPEAVAYVHALTLHTGLTGEVLDREPLPAPQPALLDGLDIERFAVTVYYGAWALEMLEEVALPLRQLGHPKATTMHTLWNESRSFLRHNIQALQRVLPALEPDHAAHVRGSLDRLQRLNARFI